MSNCSQTTITDRAFTHLSGLTNLDMSYCTQSTITDAASVHLAGIGTLVPAVKSPTNDNFSAFAGWQPSW